MAEIEPSKIWAATGVLVITIVGMAVAQIRSTGSSLAEAAALAGSASTPVLAQADYVPSSNTTTVYEAGYVSRTFGYVPAGFLTNPLTLPSTSVESTLFRSTAQENLPSEDESETESDVSQDLVDPEFAQREVPDIAVAALDEQPASDYQVAGNRIVRVARDEDSELANTDLYVTIDDSVQTVNAADLSFANYNGIRDVDGESFRIPVGLDTVNSLDLQSTGFVLNGNVHITFDPTTGQPTYLSNTLARNMNPVQAQAQAIQQAILQATPQGQALLAQQRGLGDSIALQNALADQQAQAVYLNEKRIQTDIKVLVETEETIPLIQTVDESRSQYYYW